MKTIKLLACMMLLSSAVQAAAIYECTDSSGRKVYTQDGNRNCKTSQLGKPSVYTSAPVARTAQNHTAAQEQPENRQTGQDRQQALADAQNELARARQNLEAGKNVRYGNERNYARYLERIQSLENEVNAAQQKVRDAQQSAD